MANLPLAFAELAGGAILITAAIKGDSITNVVTGKATNHPISTGAASSTNASTGAAGAGTTGAANTTVPNVTNANVQQTLTGAPAPVLAAYNRAESLVGSPYSKAGHASAFTAAASAVHQLGTDCSGLVSTVLGPLGAGVLTSAQSTQTIPSQSGITGGKGQYITIYDRTTGAVDDEHVIIDIAGQFFESGGNSSDNPSSNDGVAPLTYKDAMSELGGGGFTMYHPTGL